MFNDYYLLKRVQEEEGKVAYASVMDSFTYMGEVVKRPSHYEGDFYPIIGDKVLFLKGSGEDINIGGEQMKAVKLEDIIMTI